MCIGEETPSIEKIFEEDDDQMVSYHDVGKGKLE
jgi:hypothetical protein